MKIVEVYQHGPDMGLDVFKKPIKERIERLHNPDLCPTCGSSDTEKKEYYMRCNAGDCDVITYIPNRDGL